jgi:hypothetical protein
MEESDFLLNAHSDQGRAEWEAVRKQAPAEAFMPFAM